MPSIYRPSLILGIAGCALSFGSIALFPRLSGILCFYYFGLWLLWIACVIFSFNLTATRLIGLWLIIDFGLLGNLVAMAPGLTESRLHGGPGGNDIALLLAYAPVVFPA